MTVKPTDRRIEKTRRALKDALIYLIQDKSFESIGIQEILDRANVGRSTFYIHYASKYELLHDCFQDFGKLIQKDNKICHKQDGNDHILDMFRVVQQNQPLAKAFLGKDDITMFHRPMMDYIHDLIKLTLSKQLSINRHPTVPDDLAVHCLTYELIATMRWWLYNGTHCSAEDINRYFMRVAFDGLRDEIS